MKESMAGWPSRLCNFLQGLQTGLWPQNLELLVAFPFPRDLSHQVSRDESGWTRVLPQFQGATKKGSKYMVVRYCEEGNEGENTLPALRSLRQGSCEFDCDSKTNDKVGEHSVCSCEGMSCNCT